MKEQWTWTLENVNYLNSNSAPCSLPKIYSARSTGVHIVFKNLSWIYTMKEKKLEWKSLFQSNTVYYWFEPFPITTGTFYSSRRDMSHTSALKVGNTSSWIKQDGNYITWTLKEKLNYLLKGVNHFKKAGSQICGFSDFCK